MKTEFGYIVDNKVIAHSFLNIEERIIGDVKSSEEETIAYFKARFDTYKSAVDKLLLKISETENKGSYLVKVQDLIKNSSQECALGDFESIINQLKTVESNILNNINSNRLRNKNVKEELIASLELLLTRTIVSSDLDQVEKMKSTWKRIGKTDASEEILLQERFSKVLKEVEEHLASISSLTNELIETRIEQFKHFISEAESLFKTNFYKKNSKLFKELQSSVKEIGYIPQEKRDILWQEFNKLGNDFFAKVKEEYTEKKAIKKTDVGSLLKVKTALLEQVKSLSEVPLTDALGTRNKLKSEYKKMPFISSTAGRKLDNEFYNACSFLDERSFIESLFKRKIKNTSTVNAKGILDQKIKLVKNLIQKDLENLSNYEDNTVIVSGGKVNPFSSVLEKRKRELNRGLAHKKRILTLLKNETTKQ